jgi:membrane peptidoglycan carboxypeptidase
LNMSESPFAQRDVYGGKKPLFHGFLHRIQSKITPLIRGIQERISRLLNWLRSSSSPQQFWGRIGKCVLISGGGFFGLILLWLLFIYFTLPNVDEVGALFAAESTIITDRKGEELYRIHGDEDRTLVPLGDIVDTIEQATIAIEDQRFYTRGCFDPRAFFRAVFRNIIGGFGSQGGSTITQQFSKNALIGDRRKKISRKFREYMLSCKLEKRYSKDEILELYLNRIPYGHNAHGVEQASRIYFAKSSSGLTLAESSVLAALPQLPTYLSPYGKHVRTTLSEKGKERVIRGKLRDADDIRDDDFWIGLVGETFDLQTGETSSSTGETLYIGGRTDQVLRNMQNQSFIKDEDRLLALEELQAITFKRARENIRAPHFVLWVREQIEEQFRDQFEEGFLESGGLTITTTLDYGLQQAAEGIFAELGDLNIDLYGAHNAALISVDPKAGHILTYVGNRDYWDEPTDGNVDVIRAPRQPGSSFKPFSYVAAFLNGYNPATILYDVPTKIGDDEPENFDNSFWGPLTIRRALGASRNIPAAKSFFLAGGEEAVIGLAADVGIPSIRTRKEELTAARGEVYEYGWPLSIGAAEVPLYEMVQGYLTFARSGKAVDLVSILKIEDRLGNILYQTPEEPEERDVLDPRAAYMITSILSDEGVRPEEYWRTQLSVPGFQTAAKTGTSNKCLKRAKAASENTLGRCVDSKPDNTWTIGYTPNLVTGVWAGNASGGALYVKASGLNTASPIWRRFMIAAHKELKIKKESFPIPEGLASAQISELSGKLASSCTPLEHRRAEVFFKGEEPREFDDACTEIEVDKLTGLLASEECPVEARESGAHFRPQSVLPERWPLWESAVQNWAKDLSRSVLHSRTKIPDLVEPLKLEEAKESVFWKTIEIGEDGKPIQTFRGTGAFLPLPLPLAPVEQCTLALTPGRMEKPTLRITFPSDGGVAASPSFTPHISYKVGHAVREVRYQLDGRIVARSLSGYSLTPTIRIPRRFDTSGTHRLVVTLVDSYFNEVQDSVRFRFEEDSGAPKVSITSPREGSSLTIGSRVTVKVDARDAGGSIDRVQFFLGDQLIMTKRKEPFEATFPIEGEPGSSAIKAVAWDLARNKGEDEVGVELIR